MLAAEGVTLTLETPEGDRIRAIDGMASWWCAIHGYAVPELDARTVAIPLDSLRHKEIRICVAGGAAKVPVLRAVLQAGFVSHLVTDERTARAVLG